MAWSYSPLRTLILVGAGLLLAPPHTQACSGFRCSPGALLPVHDSSVPANALVLFWKAPVTYPQAGATPASPVHLYRLDTGGRTELPVSMTQEDSLTRITPKAPVPAGTQLVFESESAPCNASGGERTSFNLNVGPTVGMPASLGMLKLVSNGPSSVSLPVYTGECTLPFQVVSARFELQLSAEAQPLAAVLRHSLVIDGQERGQYTVPPEYPAGPGIPNLGGALSDMVFSLCQNVRPNPPNTGLAEGAHTVRWRTRLPDGVTLHSNELTFTLTCPPALADAGLTDAALGDAATDAAANEGGAELVSEAGAAGITEAGVSSPVAQARDASAERVDTATAESSPSPPRPVDSDPRIDDDERGCAIRFGAAKDTLIGWLVSLAGLLLWRRRMNRV